MVHAGVDIVAPEGSEIRSVADGTVDDVIVSPNDENYGTLGYMVIVEQSEKIGGKSVYGVYLHMKEKPKVAVGQSVKAGETVIGLVGSTGAAFGPHVHFEVRLFSGRFFPKWKNIYGIERPKEDATFDAAEFAENWLDPETFPAGVASVPSGASGAATTPQATGVSKSDVEVGPKPDAPWENSLGMKLLPVSGTKVLFCAWETRVKDFESFAKAAGFQNKGVMECIGLLGWVKKNDRSWQNPGFVQGPTHPVVGVSWDDAQAFCSWLTGKERDQKLIGTSQEYRLPTGEEWTKAVGDTKYPWGNQWPPPPGAGNYAGQEYNHLGPKIPNYHDSFPRTAPVGSFSPNRVGIFDLAGNVWEWCQDGPSPDGRVKYLRGGSWGPNPQQQLESSFAANRSTDVRNDTYGFRVVLSTKSKPNK